MSFSVLSGISVDFLPEPLTKDEEVEILQKLDNNECRNILIERNLRLVMYIAKKYTNTNIPIDDLFSTGCFGLIKATQTFNIDKSIKFATYASKCIENEILMSLRKSRKYSADISLESIVKTNKDGNDIPLKEVIPDPYAEKSFKFYENKELIDSIINTALNSMCFVHLAIILYRISDITQKNIAKRLHWSQSYISRKEKEAFEQFVRLSKKENLIVKRRKIIFSSADNFWSVKFSKKYFSDFDKIWENFFQDPYYSAVTFIQNSDWFEIYSKDEIFVVLADLLIYLE